MEKLPAGRPSGHPSLLSLLDGGLIGFIADLINTFIDDLVGSLFGTGGGGSGGLFPGLGDLIGGLGGIRDDAQEAVDTVQQQTAVITGVQNDVLYLGERIDVPTNVPLYVSMNPLEVVTFPRDDLNYSVAGQTGNSTGSTGSTDLNDHRHDGLDDNPRYTDYEDLGSHDHSLNAHSHSIVQDVKPFWTTASGNVDGAFIVIPTTTSRPFNTVGFVLGNAPELTSFQVLVYKMDLATGLIKLVHVSADIKDDLPATETEYRYRSPELITASDGEVFAPAIIQQTAGGPARTIGGKKIFPILRPSGFFPAHRSFRLTGHATPPDNVAHSLVTGNDGIIPWLCMGYDASEVTPPSKLTMGDSFNGTDAANYGNGLWTCSGGTQGRYTNVAAIPAGLQSDGTRSAIFYKDLNYDNHSVAATLATAPTSIPVRVKARLRRDQSHAVVAAVYADRIDLERQTGPNAFTVITSAPVAAVAGDRITVDCNENTHLIKVNTGTEITFPDTTGVFKKGNIYRASGFNLRRSIFTNSASLDEFEAKDT